LKKQAEDEEKRREEEERKKAGTEGKEEKKPVEKKKEEERTEQEINDEKAHLFYVDFVHEDIARLRRIEEIAQRKALKEKNKGDNKGQQKAQPGTKKPEEKKDEKKKDGKPGDKKGDKKDDKKKEDEKKAEEVITLDIDLRKIQKIRVDHKYGQAYKMLFHFDDESVTTVQVPTMPDHLGQIFMEEINNEELRIQKEELKRKEDWEKAQRKREREEKRKRIAAKKKGEEYVAVPLEKYVSGIVEKKEEEKKIIDQSIYYVNNFKEIAGIRSIFNPDMKHFTFWGVEFKVKKDEVETKAQEVKNADEEKKKVEEEKKKAEEKKQTEDKKEAEKLKDDFIQNYNLSRMGLKLHFFIDYHATPADRKDDGGDEETKMKFTNTISPLKYVDDDYSKKFDEISTFLKEILPDCTVVGNRRKPEAIGIFKVYTYGLGEVPGVENVLFSNHKNKFPLFPKPSTLYYELINEFIKYDDLKKLETKQKAEFESKPFSDSRYWICTCQGRQENTGSHFLNKKDYYLFIQYSIIGLSLTFSLISSMSCSD
jgi:hypothetical protein